MNTFVGGEVNPNDPTANGSALVQKLVSREQKFLASLFWFSSVDLALPRLCIYNCSPSSLIIRDDGEQLLYSESDALGQNVRGYTWDRLGLRSVSKNFRVNLGDIE